MHAAAVDGRDGLRICGRAVEEKAGDAPGYPGGVLNANLIPLRGLVSS
jgi:hypothetical protein